MSLQIWLPLNGNLKNQGCNTTNPVQSTAPTYVNGKLGKAMAGGAFYLPAADVVKFYNNKAMSFAFWIYPMGSSSGGQVIIGKTNMSAGDNRMFSIFQYPNPVDIHLSWQSETSSGTFLAGTFSNVLTASTWNHVAVTYNGSTATLYVNGTQAGTLNGTSTRTNFSYDVPVPNNTTTRYLSDIRIYDHCLSVAEVKELSKGLVCHYKLDDQHESSLTNKYSGAKAAGQCSGNFTRTPLESGRGFNYKLTRTGTGSSSWPNMNIGSTYTFTAGKRYYYSCKVRCHKWTSGSLSMRASRSSNDWVTNAVQVCSPSLADGKWHEYYTSQIVNETYDRSGTTITCAPILEFYSSDQKAEGTVFDMDFDVKDLQVVESDVYVPFIQNEFLSTTVVDSSGNGYNGTRSGTLTPSTNTPRYSLSTVFAASSGCFSNPNIVLSQFTISFWGKHTAANKMLMGSNASLSSTNTNWYWYGDNSFKYPSGEFYYAHNAGSAESLLGTWIHFVAVYDGANITIYRNGVNEGSKAVTGDMTLTYLSIGMGYNQSSFWAGGSVSDFRIYATCLSADDVKRLYNTAASVAKNGSLLGYEMKEG